MKPLKIDATFNTPKLDFDPGKGYLLIEGRSIPENPGQFYELIFEWLNDYYSNPKDETTVEIKLEYVNSGSSKYILEFLRSVSNYHNEGKNSAVHWYFEEEDESIEELGEHFEDLVQVPFFFHVIEEDEDE
ncbi:MAG: DUF1987 domain-containing protein [Bacteroidales bacterium]|nr:DUF1987 domain-containing protein [Bacteroidales bacterium]